jgi:hypothetical protein
MNEELCDDVVWIIKTTNNHTLLLTPRSRVILQNGRSASPELPRLLGNQEIHYGVPTARHWAISWSHESSPHTLSLRSDLILLVLPFTPRSSRWYIPFRLSDQSILLLSNACYMPHKRRPPSCTSLDLYNFLQPPVTFSLSSPNKHPKHPVLNFNLSSSPNVRIQV